MHICSLVMVCGCSAVDMIPISIRHTENEDYT
jgi:hypothetical protein